MTNHSPSSPNRPEIAPIEHVLRQTDLNPQAARRAERQVAAMFALSALMAVLFVVAYVGGQDRPLSPRHGPGMRAIALLFAGAICALRLREAGVDLKQLARDGVTIFFTQVFRDGFFHADMHPGNIFVSPEGRYMAVDFGIMGTLTDVDKNYLAQNFLAFFQRDYRRVAEVLDDGTERERGKVLQAAQNQDHAGEQADDHHDHGGGVEPGEADPAGVAVTHVETAREMQKAVEAALMMARLMQEQLPPRKRNNNEPSRRSQGANMFSVPALAEQQPVRRKRGRPPLPRLTPVEAAQRMLEPV